MKTKKDLKEAVERLAEARAKLTPKQQLAVLDKRVGPNGAKKERARLLKLLGQS